MPTTGTLLWVSVRSCWSSSRATVQSISEVVCSGLSPPFLPQLLPLMVLLQLPSARASSLLPGRIRRDTVFSIWLQPDFVRQVHSGLIKPHKYASSCEVKYWAPTGVTSAHPTIQAALAGFCSQTLPRKSLHLSPASVSSNTAPAVG